MSKLRSYSIQPKSGRLACRLHGRAKWTGTVICARNLGGCGRVLHLGDPKHWLGRREDTRIGPTMDAVRPGIFYDANFLKDDRTCYSDVLEEFFAQEPEPISMGGPRIGNIAVRTDRPNSYTDRVQLSRRQLSRKLWCPATAVLAGHVGAATGVSPTIAVMNFYRDGDDYLRFHSDYDHQIGPSVDDVVVATVSLGTPRVLQLAKIDGSDELSLLLHPGSLFVMRGRVQREWLHAIPADAGQPGSRLSLTFLHHQLDPTDKQCWVLARFSKEAEAQMEALRPPQSRRDEAFADVVRDYTGAIATPVLIGTREEVFAAWCRHADWADLLVTGPESGSFHRHPSKLIALHPELREHVPDDAPFDLTDPAEDAPAWVKDLPAPDQVPLKALPLEWLSEMTDLAIKEMERRGRE